MKKRKILLLILAVAVIAIGIYFATTRPPREISLTGVVTTDIVIVSPEVQGRLQQVLVREGETVTNGQLLAVIWPQESKADAAFYEQSREQSASMLTQAEAELKYQEAQTSNQVDQAEATLASTRAQVAQAEADLENAQITFKRQGELYSQGVEAAQAFDQTRTAYDAAKARLESARKLSQASQAAVALAKSGKEQTAARRAAMEAGIHQLAAAGAQADKAGVRLGYTEIRAPIDGIVDTRAALQGEVVNPGQAIVTLINPDNLWVRADVEESYMDRIRLGDKRTVRLASGAQSEGTIFFRGVNADYATQRDVSRTKRDIKTFEIRLRCDNRDRSLAVGMTAYVTLPLIPR
jgi:multidrug resistance efflux pump